MNPDTTTPRIYVACLASYNNGTLHGIWIDATQTPEVIRDEIKQMLIDSEYPNVQVDCPECVSGGYPSCETCNGTGKVSSAEEYAIHDHEGFQGIQIGEYASIEDVARIAELLEKHGEVYAAARTYYSDEEEAIDALDRYAGLFGSAKDFAEDFFCEQWLGQIPEPVRGYIDYESYRHDMECNGEYFEVASTENVGKVHIFWTS